MLILFSENIALPFGLILDPLIADGTFKFYNLYVADTPVMRKLRAINKAICQLNFFRTNFKFQGRRSRRRRSFSGRQNNR